MEELSLTFNFSARYFKLGKITRDTRAIWFVLHGYGQLAQYFITKFKPLADNNVCVIAPEGLSRFYLEDVNTRNQTGNNRVGATWMTRENRLMDIRNYLLYLDSVYNVQLSDHPHLPVTLLGFSQGAATASRWAVNQSVRYESLVLWSGIFPNDMDFEKSKEILKTKKVKQVYGNQDPFLTNVRIGEMKDLSEKLGVAAQPIVFTGGHEIHEETLLSLI